MLQIGHLKIDHPIFLAPMAGITDHPFRVLCRRFGVGVVYTEFVSANGVIREGVKTFDLARFTDDERPIGIQVFGEDADTIAQSAAMLVDRLNPDIIDLNFGCPVPKVTKRGAGSAMLRDLNLMRSVVRATVQAVPNTPVTVKMRAGWDQNCIVAVDAARIIADEGAAAITLHPRTTKMGFEGKADWSLIKAVKETVSIPVIGNGDIGSAHDAMRMFEETGCDAVMVARGALGNPWLFQDISQLMNGGELIPVTMIERIEVCRTHLHLMLDSKSERLAVNLMKKHIGWYLKGFPGAASWRKKVIALDDAASIDNTLKELGDAIPDQAVPQPEKIL